MVERAPQLPEYRPICVSVKVPEIVLILNWPEAGQVTEYHTVLAVVPDQQEGIVGSPVPLAQELSPARLTPSVRDVALQGKSLELPVGTGELMYKFEYAL